MNSVILNDSAFIKKLERFGIILVLVGLAGSVLAGVFDVKRLFAGYLIGFTFVMGVTVTAMFFSALQFLANAGWSALIRRIAEMFTPFIYIVAIGFIPIIFDVLVTHKLFHWTHPELLDPAAAEFDPILYGKSTWYLNPTFFALRCAFYVVVWLLMYKVIIGNSFKQDQDGSNAEPTRRNKVLSAPFILLFAITITAAGVDMVMSLDPHWFSTMFGVYFFAGNFVATLSLITIFTVRLKEEGSLPHVSDEHYHDLGKFLFAFNVFWTYIGFSQFMLYWYANIPEETVFYMKRLQNGWDVFFWILVLLHFIVPFCILLMQKAKRNPKVLVAMSILFLVMQFCDLCWYVLPEFSKEGLRISYHEVAPFVMLFGMLLFWTARQYKTRNAVAINDPFMRESIELTS